MKRKKKKFNILKFIIFLLIIYLLYYVISYIFSVRTKNIVVLNNNYYKDEVIIETAEIENYPKFLLLNRRSVKKKLLKLDLIEDVIISKKYGNILELNIKEKKILYFNKEKNMYKCSDNEYYEIDNIIGVPLLINYVPEDIENKFTNEFSKIDESIINRISEIEYSSTSYDKERFLLYMNDGILVYINISKLSALNKYVEIVKKLENHKGILYLDSGNYFEIKE